MFVCFLKKPKSEISFELGHLISSLLKLNIRQLINKKSKRKKSSISFLTSNETKGDQTVDAHQSTTSVFNHGSTTTTNSLPSPPSLVISSTQIKPISANNTTSNSNHTNTGGANNSTNPDRSIFPG